MKEFPQWIHFVNEKSIDENEREKKGINTSSNESKIKVVEEKVFASNKKVSTQVL